MLNVIKLNWSSIKYYHRGLLAILIVLLLIGWASTILLVPVATFLLFSLSINPFSAEDRWGVNRLYLTLPVKRKTIVTSRYLLALLLYAGGTLFGLAMMPLTNLFSLSKWYPDYRWILALLAFSFLLRAVMSLSMYPLLFWLGYHKGWFWGFYLPSGILCIAYVALAEYDRIAKDGKLLFDLLVYASEHMLLVSGGMFALGAVLLGVSYALSCRLYAKREF